MKFEQGNIIYHDTFGFGVVKKYDGSIIDVFFSDGTLRKLMAFNASVLIVNNTLIDRVVNVETSHYFDSWTLSKAKSYIDSISNIEYFDGKIIAEIKGTYYYQTLISLNNKNNLKFDCDCPVSGYCKHEAALYLKIKDIFAMLRENTKISSIDIEIMKKIKNIENMYYQNPVFFDVVFEIHNYVIDNLSNDIVYSTLKCIQNLKSRNYRGSNYEYLIDTLVFDDRIRKFIIDNPSKYDDLDRTISDSMEYVSYMEDYNNYGRNLTYYFVNENYKKVATIFLRYHGRGSYYPFLVKAFENVEMDDELYKFLHFYLENDGEEAYVGELIKKTSFDQLIELVKDELCTIYYRDIKNYSSEQKRQLMKYIDFVDDDIDELLANNFDDLDNKGIARIIYCLFHGGLSKSDAQKLFKVVKTLPNNKHMLEHLEYLDDYNRSDYYYRRNRSQSYYQDFIDGETFNYNDEVFFTYFYTSYEVYRVNDSVVAHMYLYDLDNNEVIDSCIYNNNRYHVETNKYDGENDSKVIRYVIDYILKNNRDDYRKKYQEIADDILKEKDLKRSRQAKYQLQSLSKIENPILLKDNHKARLEYYFDIIDSNFTLSLKVGIDKMYVVKNAIHFIDNLRNGVSEEYGKNFTFSHTLNNFENVDRKILEALLRSSFSTYYYKELDIQNDMLDFIFETLKDRTIYFKKKPYKLTLDTKELDISINDEYRIILNGEFDKYNYIFTDNKVYTLDENSKTIDCIEGTNREVKIYNYLINNQYTKIDSFVDEFKENIYYDYSNIISVDDKLKKEFKIDEIKIKAYFDYDDKLINVRSEYYIDDALVDESKIKENHNLIRKNRYLDYLDSLGFVDNVLVNDGDILNFFSMDFSDLKKYCEVYLSESITNKKLYQFEPGTIKINYENNMMEAFLQESKYSDDELYEILQAIKKKKKFVIMSDDRIVNIDSKEAGEFLEAVDDLGLKKKNLSQSVSLPISKALKAFAYEQECEIDEYLLNMVNDISNFKNCKLRLPKLNGELRGYQKDGYKWLSILNKYHVGGILADDMGLGKTIEVISLIVADSNKKPNLIVCPKSVVFNWINEFKRFAPNEEVEEIYGLKNVRDNVVSNIKNNKKVTYVVSYDSLRNDIESYKMNFNYVILDEAQYIKNVNAQKTSSVKRLKAEHHLALTGTPIENNIIDLWSIFDFIMPGYFEDLETFKHKYESDDKFVEKVAKRIAPFVLRRNKQNVLKDLPDKYEHIISAQMTSKQQKIYDAHVKQARDLLESGYKAFDVLPYLMRLRQICIDPRLFVENYTGDSGKLNMLKDIVAEYTNNGHRILIFSQFVKAIDEVKKILDGLKLSYFVITGDTSAKKRIEICDSFNNNSEEKVVLISLKAGGTGLNLTGADTVIHLDPWWNVAATDQATDRTYRIGQTKNVEVIKLICENSIEQRVIELQNIKKDLIDKLISNDESSVVNATLEDIKFIIS